MILDDLQVSARNVERRLYTGDDDARLIAELNDLHARIASIVSGEDDRQTERILPRFF